MGTDAACSSSTRQKLNTKSSTEAELVGLDDVLPQALWTKCFVEAQCHGVSTVLNQDNQSTIKLSENGKASSGKRTRHINIRCFARKEVAIQCCPTKEMVADCFTSEPLQGELSHKFRDQIMGVVPVDAIIGHHRSVLDDLSDNQSPSARPNRASTGKTTGHQSWADVVRPKPSKGSIGRLTPIIKR
jgi:hypothetical protein